jgi:hypothetical protein
VNYRRVFGLDDLIYWHLIHIVRGYRQYSPIVIPTLYNSPLHTHTHTKWFSVFTSRILATDL